MRTMMHTQGKLIHVCCKRGLVVYCCVAYWPTTLFVSTIDKQAWKGHNAPSVVTTHSSPKQIAGVVGNHCMPHWPKTNPLFCCSIPFSAQNCYMHRELSIIII